MKKLILGFLLLPVYAFGIDVTDCASATKLATLYQFPRMILPTYGSHTPTTVSAACAISEKKGTEALVELLTLKAVARDTPANPNYDTITTLKKIRNTLTPEIIDDEIASLEPGDSFPLYRFVSELRRANTLIR